MTMLFIGNLLTGLVTMVVVPPIVGKLRDAGKEAGWP